MGAVPGHRLGPILRPCGLGLLWSLVFPIIKLLWTSSFVLVGGGCAKEGLAPGGIVDDSIGKGPVYRGS